MLIGLFTSILLWFFLRQGRGPFFFLAVIFVCPIVYYLIPLKNPFSAWVVLLSVSVIGLRLKKNIFPSRWRYFFWAGLWPILYFAFYWCCLHHADFYPIGERFRDLALLAAVKKNFVHPTDPWFAGHELKYYLYWYRLGAYFSELLRLPIALAYHGLLAFCFASFITLMAHFFRWRVGLSFSAALLMALLAALSPNGEGLKFLFSAPWNLGADWWAMTRVIKGTINEFPAWSFTLGDLHPHFCNLGLIFFFLELILGVVQSPGSELGLSKRAHTAFLIALALLFWRNTNPWELPLVLMLMVLLLVFYIWRGRNVPFFSWPPMRRRGLMIMSIFAILAASLALSSRSLPAAELPLNWVLPQWRSDFQSFISHWSWPFALLFFWQLRGLWWKFFSLFFFTLAWAYDIPAFWAPLILLASELSLAWQDRRPWWESAVAALFFVSLIFPEIVFFDDAYGGPNERMNTIFKFYIFLWPLLFTLLAFRIKERGFLWKIPLSGMLILALLFFTKLQIVRRPFHSSSPLWTHERGQGLESLEKTYPGGSEIITFLRQSPHAVLAEGTTQAYSWSTHLASLSGVNSYLGWDNHINLLYREYEEVARRRRVLGAIYTGENCADRKALLVQEKIQFLALGPLEKAAYSPYVDFSCLNKVASAGLYEIYSP